MLIGASSYTSNKENKSLELITTDADLFNLTKALSDP